MKKRIALIIVVFTLIFIDGCSNPELPYIPLIDDSKSNKIEETKSENSIKIGIASVISPQATRVGYDSFIHYLEEKLNTPIILIQGKTYEETNQLIKEGKVDIALICSLAYVIGEDSGIMQGIAAPKMEGKPLYRSYIIVREDSNIKTMNDLKDKRFAFTDPYSYSGRLAPMYMLWQKGIFAEDFFKKTYFTYSHDYSIKAVAKGIVDGAAVDSLVYDQMLKAKMEDINNIRIIAYGDWVGTPPIVVSNHLSDSMVKNVQNILFNMNKDAKGKEILEGLNIDEFVPIDFANYQPISNMLDIIGEK